MLKFRVFIPVARKPLGDILFSARPEDLPAALVLILEVESKQIAANFAKNMKDKIFGNEQDSQNITKTGDRYQQRNNYNNRNYYSNIQLIALKSR